MKTEKEIKILREYMGNRWKSSNEDADLYQKMEYLAIAWIYNDENKNIKLKTEKEIKTALEFIRYLSSNMGFICSSCSSEKTFEQLKIIIEAVENVYTWVVGGDSNE